MADVEEEFRLAQVMKEKYCDKSGKEIDVVKTGEIIYCIGKIYRKRSPDKISLIKSAGLYNAAIVRNPSNLSEIKSNLSELCQHVLQLAKANNQKADLIKEAKHVKCSVAELRKEVEMLLRTKVPKLPNSTSSIELEKLKSNKISAIQQINKLIADKYRIIMHELSLYCQDVMGKPPCEYAIVGMGSLAREEITPYSDFEHVILLCDSEHYESYLDYFKWYSVIFHIIVLNIRETIIPSLNICSLNDKNCLLKDWFYDGITLRGISFDGMMPHACKFPLGRQTHTETKKFTTELIKPVSEMLKYLSSAANLKNGYHLADILTKTCYVFGDKNVFKQFVDGAQTYRDKKNKYVIIDEIKQQVKDDLNNFSMRFQLTKLKSQDSINIKQLVYRSITLFVSALASKHNISANSCFDIIDKMVQKNEMTRNTANKLQYAISIACEIRLKVYTEKKCQCDSVVCLNQVEKNIQNFLDIVGAASSINYFQIVYCMQCEIAKQFHLTKLHFYSNPQLINVTIALVFGIPKGNVPNSCQISKKLVWNSKNFDFDRCIAQLETNLNLSCDIYNKKRKIVSAVKLKYVNKKIVKLHEINEIRIESLAISLKSSEEYDEALDFYQQLLEIYAGKTQNNYSDNYLAWINEQIGVCLQFLNREQDALIYFKKSLKIKQATHNDESDRCLAATLYSIGDCHVSMQQYEYALKYLNQAFKIEQNTTVDADNDRDMAATLHSIGVCHSRMQQYEHALKYLSRALDIEKNPKLNDEQDRNLATTIYSIGECHAHMQRYRDALKFFNQALSIELQTTLNDVNDRNLAITYHSIGDCHAGTQQYKDALKYFNKALQLEQILTLDAGKDKNLAMTLHSIGDCFGCMQQYDKALKYLKQALQIKQNTTFNADTDRNLAATLHSIGECHKSMQKYETALKCLNQALEIEQNSTLNAENDRKLAASLHSIGDCHARMRQYDKALEYLNRALKIKEKTTLNADNDRNLALTLDSIGICCANKQWYDDALKNLYRALEIIQNTTLNSSNDRKLAATLHSIGDCHASMQQQENALKHLNRALEIKENTTLNAYNDANLAAILHSIGECHASMQLHEDALNYFKRAFEIQQNATLNADKDSNIAATLLSIADCHSKLQHYNDVLKYLHPALKIKQNILLNVDSDKSLACRDAVFY